ncbi:MAG TPA: 30S ribosomal protein S16 [Opitutaceae bacterium]
MALKIRLARYGATHNPVYRIVVAEARSRRDGAAVEQLGIYQPKVSDTPLKVNIERADFWVGKGARPTETVASLLKRARRATAATATTATTAATADSTTTATN